VIIGFVVGWRQNLSVFVRLNGQVRCDHQRDLGLSMTPSILARLASSRPGRVSARFVFWRTTGHYMPPTFQPYTPDEFSVPPDDTVKRRLLRIAARVKTGG
jgi:hypothetical protein